VKSESLAQCRKERCSSAATGSPWGLAFLLAAAHPCSNFPGFRHFASKPGDRSWFKTSIASPLSRRLQPIASSPRDQFKALLAGPGGDPVGRCRSIRAWPRRRWIIPPEFSPPASRPSGGGGGKVPGGCTDAKHARVIAQQHPGIDGLLFLSEKEPCSTIRRRCGR